MVRISLCAFVAMMTPAFAETPAEKFSAEELGVAEFWKNMGPTLSNDGVEAYAIRYHEDFTHWGIGAALKVSDKASAVRYWSKFHEDGHRIVCTHVEPVTVSIIGDHAFARFIYEQTDKFADDRPTATNVFAMAAVFKRYEDTWQTLQTNMTVLDAVDDDAADKSKYTAVCQAE